MGITFKIRQSIYAGTLFLIILSGFGQMPIFKRYYIADIPGLGWLAQFYVTHMIHYIAATVLIGFVTYVLIDFILNGMGKGRISGSGYARIVILAGLIVSGAMMVIKNLPGVYFNHSVIIALDLFHLGSCVILLLVSFYSLILKKRWVN